MITLAILLFILAAAILASPKYPWDQGAPMTIKQFPHCDPRVLHAPGECQFCDRHPDWQELRIVWGINFTNHDATDDNHGGKMLPCPCDHNRGLGGAHVWGGNTPKPSLPTHTCNPTSL